MAQVYGNRWKIVGDLGKGGQSDVFRATDESGALQGEFALKRVRNPKRFMRFAAEVNAIKQLNHPSIIELIDHSALDAEPDNLMKQFIVMPIASGGDLLARAEIYKDSLDSTLIVAKQLASALLVAHSSGIIHRDVKPQNVLFKSVGHDAILTDFGICIISDRPRATETDEVVGPWAFMAPELEGGGHLEVSPAADVYSLGKVIYFMISGGVVLPRERLHEDKYSSIFSKGERYTLLQVLLGKMICPLESRMREMKQVLAELDRLEAWETNARIAPLSPNASSALERMKQQEIERQRATSEANQARERQKQTLSVISMSYKDWVRVELETTSASIHVPGLLESRVKDVQLPDNSRFNIGRHDFIVPLCGVEIFIEKPHDPFRKAHALQLYLCQEAKVRFYSGNMPPPMPQEDVNLVFLPYYYRYEEKMRDPWQGFINTVSYMRRDRTHVRKTFIGGSCTIKHDFRASEWPTVTDKLKLALAEALEVFINYIESGANSLGS